MWISRKLEDARRDLTPLEEQGKVVGFLTNTKITQKIDSLVEDVREAVMDYQVGVSGGSLLPRLTFALDFAATRHLREELSAHRESHPSSFVPTG